MTNPPPLPRPSPPGPLQQLRGKTSAGCRGSTLRRLAEAGRCCAAVCVSLLLVLAQLPPALGEFDAVEFQINVDTVLPPITEDATCADWVAWIPRRSEPAVVMQVVSQDYISIQQNFIRLMERNSSFNRHNLYLMCIDDASRRFFEEQMGVRCVPLSALHLPRPKEIWMLRVQVLSCLVRVGRVDVIMSDADALWLNDPAQELYSGGRSGSNGDAGSSSGGYTNGRSTSVVDLFGGSGDDGRRRAPGAGGGAFGGVRDSDVVASRGNYPSSVTRTWGTTMCMGFILFRAKNVAGMAALLGAAEGLVMKTKDDQVSINQAVKNLGVVWETDGDMRYENSTGYGLGEIPAARILAVAGNGGNPGGGPRLALGDGHEEVFPLTVTLLPHSTYTRVCEEAPVSMERTVVAHCLHPAKVGRAEVKTSWMQALGLWSVQDDP